MFVGFHFHAINAINKTIGENVNFTSFPNPFLRQIKSHLAYHH